MAGLVGTSQGMLTYIDAVVTGMTGTANTTGPVGTTASATAWQIRGSNGSADASAFGNEGSVLQYNTNPVDAANPILTTTLTGLSAAATYRVHVLYWDDLGQDAATPPTLPANSPWDVSAAVTGEAFTQFDSTVGNSNFMITDMAGLVNTVDVAAAGYNALPMNQITGLNVLGQGTDDFTDAYDNNRGAFVGTLPGTFTGVTDLAVQILPGTLSAQRSWYDGIILETVVVPEPSSALMIGLAGLGLLRRKRA